MVLPRVIIRNTEKRHKGIGQGSAQQRDYPQPRYSPFAPRDRLIRAIPPGHSPGAQPARQEQTGPDLILEVRCQTGCCTAGVFTAGKMLTCPTVLSLPGPDPESKSGGELSVSTENGGVSYLPSFTGMAVLVSGF